MPILTVQIELSEKDLANFWKMSKKIALHEYRLMVFEKDTIQISANQLIREDVRIYAELMTNVSEGLIIFEKNAILELG